MTDARQGAPDRDALMQAITQMIGALGLDPEANGLTDTPRRIADMYLEVFEGLWLDPHEPLSVQFEEGHSEMVILRDVPFYSMCEHHLLPFFGKIHVAYIPQNQVVGLSKIPRLVDVFARRLQIQERMTNQIAQTILDKVKPIGVAVVCEGTHLCMSMRGVEKQNSCSVTSAMLGVFRENARTRMEFLELIRHRGHSRSVMSSEASVACVNE